MPGSREVQRLHGDLEAIALLADAVLDWNDDIGEREGRRVGRALTHLVEVLLDLDARRIHRDDEGRDSAVTLGRIRLCEDDGPRRPTGVGDEGLGAVEDVLVAAPLGRRLHSCDIRPRVGLAEPERAENRLLEERREPGLLLLVGTGDEHRPGTETVREDRRPDTGAAPVQLLADEHSVERGQAQASERLWDVQIHQAELVRLRDHVDGVGRMLVVLGRLRPDLLLGELARERAKLTLLRRQRERDAAGDAGLQLGHGRHSRVD